MISYKTRKRLMPVVLLAIGLVATAIYIFPLYWMVVTSLKSPIDVFRIPPELFPSQIVFDSYLEVLGVPSTRGHPTIDGLLHLRNTLYIAMSTTFLTLVLAVPGSYALARFKLRGTSLFMLLLLVFQMVPNVLLVIPLFVLFKSAGLVNTYLSVILADTALALPFGIIFLRTSFLQVPADLEEAALLDGCSQIEALWHVVLPLVRAGLAAVAAFTFLYAWGEFVFAMSFLQNESLHPIPMIIYKFIDISSKEWDSIMAFSTVLALPALIAFLLLQRQFLGGLTEGAVK